MAQRAGEPILGIERGEAEVGTYKLYIALVSVVICNWRTEEYSVPTPLSDSRGKSPSDELSTWTTE